MRAAHHNLGTFGRFLDFDDIGFDMVTVLIALRRDLFRRREHGYGLTQVNEDVAILHALYEAAHDITLTARELLVDDATLCLTDALYHHLFGRLRGHAAEVSGRNLNFDNIAHLIVRFQRARLSERNLLNLIHRLLHHGLNGIHMVVTGITREGHADVLRGAEIALIRRNEGSLNRLEQNFGVDALFLCELMQGVQELLPIVLGLGFLR